MFVVDRSALAVLVPLALLGVVVLWSNHSQPRAATQADTPSLEENQELASRGQAVAANLPSR